MTTFESVRHISVTIERPPARVYDFASNPANLPSWAARLSGAIRQVDGDWVAESPMGDVVVRFVAPNELGVMDHDVVLKSGVSVHNPLRVVPNGDAARSSSRSSVARR